jgi:hypothetical protein
LLQELHRVLRSAVRAAAPTRRGGGRRPRSFRLGLAMACCLVLL